MARVILASVVVVGMLSGPEPPAHVHTQTSAAVRAIGPDTGPEYVSPLLQLGDVPGPVIDPEPPLEEPTVLDVFGPPAPEPEPEHPPAPVPALPVPAPVPAAGGCCTHTDAWWHGVAICEQGGRNDPYFGYFSFMDGSQGGRPWDDQVAAGNALLNRVGHEIGPWAESCVRAGYAASPGG